MHSFEYSVEKLNYITNFLQKIQVVINLQLPATVISQIQTPVRKEFPPILA